MDINPAKAYLEGMFWAAYGSNLIRGTVAEWQIDAVKKCASVLKEAEIDHMMLSDDKKSEFKKQWKAWIEIYAQGFKDELKREGKL